MYVISWKRCNRYSLSGEKILKKVVNSEFELVLKYYVITSRITSLKASPINFFITTGWSFWNRSYWIPQKRKNKKNKVRLNRIHNNDIENLYQWSIHYTFIQPIILNKWPFFGFWWPTKNHDNCLEFHRIKRKKNAASTNHFIIMKLKCIQIPFHLKKKRKKKYELP